MRRCALYIGYLRWIYTINWVSNWSSDTIVVTSTCDEAVTRNACRGLGSNFPPLSRPSHFMATYHTILFLLCASDVEITVRRTHKILLQVLRTLIHVGCIMNQNNISIAVQRNWVKMMILFLLNGLKNSTNKY